MADVAEMAKRFAEEAINNVEQADADALLASEAFALGVGEEYIEARQSDILRRLEERYGRGKTASDGGSGGEDSGVDTG